MSVTKSTTGAKGVCLYQLRLSGQIVANSTSDFTGMEMYRAEVPLRSVQAVLVEAIHALDDAVALLPESAPGEFTGAEACGGKACGPVESLSRRLTNLSAALAVAPDEHFVSTPPAQPRLPFAAPETVAEAVMGLGMFLAMLAGEIEVVRTQLGKQKPNRMDI